MSHPSTAQSLESMGRTHEVRLSSRFCGPPGSGNGGYTVGLIGKELGDGAEVTLKRPIPLERALQVVFDGVGEATLLHDGVEVAVATSAELEVDIPEAVSFSQAAAARARFLGYRSHPFPGCFVCGTGRSCIDGMCLFAGPVQDGIVASSWVPASDFATASGAVMPELVCAALDCPGAWGLFSRYGMESPCVLGRMTYRIDKPILAGGRYVVMGWALGRERRKSFCGTAVYDATGEVCAAARSTWIQLG